MKRTFARFTVLFLSILSLIATVGCSARTSAVQTTATAESGSRQSASVAYAGSLQLVNDVYLGPAFSKATGLRYTGRGGGSFGVANLISSREIQPNVFESVGNAPIARLEPEFTTWSVGFAATPLVLAYLPQGPFGPELQAIADGKEPLKDVFTIMAQPGFHLGRTNPETDPQGQAFIIMLELAARKYSLPAGTVDRIMGEVDNPAEIFAETALISRLEAGQLDACSAYMPEAVQRKLQYIVLPDAINQGNPGMAAAYAAESVTLKSGETVKGTPLVLYVTDISGTPDAAAGVSFVKYLLSPAGLKIYQEEGYSLLPTSVIEGDGNAIPAGIKSELR